MFERLEIHPQGPPDIAAALILHCGDRTAEVRSSSENADLATRKANAAKIEDVEVAGVSCADWP